MSTRTSQEAAFVVAFSSIDYLRTAVDMAQMNKENLG